MTPEKTTGKSPAFQFYASDWLRDAGLTCCSLAARGLWIELLSHMHLAEPTGRFTLNGRAPSLAQTARLCRSDERAVKAALDELEEAGVFSRTEDGALYSRRMVRDAAARAARAEGGKKGAEHGARGAEHGARGGRPKREQGGIQNPPPTNIEGGFFDEGKPASYPPPSSSSSSSSSQGSTSVAPAEIGESSGGGPALPGGAAAVAAGPQVEIDRAVIDAWNAAVVGTKLKPVEYATAARRREARRLAGWFEGDAAAQVTACSDLFRRIAATDFCAGRARSGWLASFEWACDHDNAAKVLEGRFFELRKGVRS